MSPPYWELTVPVSEQISEAPGQDVGRHDAAARLIAHDDHPAGYISHSNDQLVRFREDFLIATRGPAGQAAK